MVLSPVAENQFQRTREMDLHLTGKDLHLMGKYLHIQENEGTQKRILFHNHRRCTA